jgi:hypothetical protein
VECGAGTLARTILEAAFSKVPNKCKTTKPKLVHAVATFTYASRTSSCSMAKTQWLCHHPNLFPLQKLGFNELGSRTFRVRGEQEDA